ncbi:MAG TPA: hypothetical protein VGQ76_08520 [Thermoanaerobaculia bacterium]|jgi:hypothetical protein|nr:hypothetical protein [Thermoanaerobaculia bacterium]
MRVNMDQLSNDAYVWIFGISPSLDAQKSDALLRQVNGFLENWAAHGTPIPGAAEVREGSFLIVAADEQREKSGCSIDRMFGTLKQLERDLEVAILDSNRVFFREGESVRAVARSEFKGTANAESPVFDVLVERLGDVREGVWVKPASQSWHRQLL